MDTSKFSLDIETERDVWLLVNQFYYKVRRDELLAPVFEKVIAEEEWNKHLGVMCDFWSTVLLHSMAYRGNPMAKHFPLQIGKQHFERWLDLFGKTVDGLFSGPVATEAIRRANIIAKNMMYAKGINEE